MKNKELSDLFTRIADALEIKGESGFKVIAYRKASRSLEELSSDVETLSKEGNLQSIPGIGSGITKKIEEYLQTGRMKKLDEAMAGLPEGLLDLLNIQNLGGKTIHLAHQELGVKNLSDLKRVIADGSLAKLYGMGEKKVENIKKGIELYEHAQERIPIFEAVTLVEEMMAYLRKNPKFEHVSEAGSLRRMKETVGDIDILATGPDGAFLIEYFTKYPGITRILASGKTKGAVMVSTEKGERQIDLRIVDKSSFGAALQYFTGSKAHNIKIRSLAREKSLKISEYGVFKGGEKIAGPDEKKVYEAIGLSWVDPEMREDRGEVELAQEGKLPDPVKAEDIKGDLHAHSQWSDGKLSIKEIANLASQMGYEYIAVCDHSQSVKYANGLTPQRLEEQMAEIDRLNRNLQGIKILKGAEVDILANGELDFPDELLQRLDILVAAVHSGFRRNVTERMIQAMRNPQVNVIAHPSGRLISKREGYEVNLNEVLDEAAKQGVALELNAYYDRLDLNEFYLRKAKEKGILISLGTDAHSKEGLKMMRFGVGIARRAWLEKKDILNCLNYKALKHKLL